MLESCVVHVVSIHVVYPPGSVIVVCSLVLVDKDAAGLRNRGEMKPPMLSDDEFSWSIERFGHMLTTFVIIITLLTSDLIFNCIRSATELRLLRRLSSIGIGIRLRGSMSLPRRLGRTGDMTPEDIVSIHSTARVRPHSEYTAAFTNIAYV